MGLLNKLEINNKISHKSDKIFGQMTQAKTCQESSFINFLRKIIFLQQTINFNNLYRFISFSVPSHNLEMCAQLPCFLCLSSCNRLYGTVRSEQLNIPRDLCCCSCTELYGNVWPFLCWKFRKSCLLFALISVSKYHCTAWQFQYGPVWNKCCMNSN